MILKDNYIERIKADKRLKSYGVIQVLIKNFNEKKKKAEDKLVNYTTFYSIRN